jgi:hypothetical protein
MVQVMARIVIDKSLLHRRDVKEVQLHVQGNRVKEYVTNG